MSRLGNVHQPGPPQRLKIPQSRIGHDRLDGRAVPAANHRSQRSGVWDNNPGHKRDSLAYAGRGLVPAPPGVPLLRPSPGGRTRLHIERLNLRSHQLEAGSDAHCDGVAPSQHEPEQPRSGSGGHKDVQVQQGRRGSRHDQARGGIEGSRIAVGTYQGQETGRRGSDSHRTVARAEPGDPLRQPRRWD
jgi:hypothetical protein